MKMITDYEDAGDCCRVTCVNGIANTWVRLDVGLGCREKFASSKETLDFCFEE